MIIYLVGLPGSGKSTLGKKLSASIQYPFLDLDEIIEKHVSKTITQIFEEDGEEYFRIIEKETLHKLDYDNLVLATGGGTPCFHNNMEFMNKNGTTLFIDTPVEKINERLNKRDLHERPLFKSISVKKTTEYLHDLRERRLPYYQKSKLTIPDSSLKISEIAGLLKIKSN